MATVKYLVIAGGGGGGYGGGGGGAGGYRTATNYTVTAGTYPVTVGGGGNGGTTGSRVGATGNDSVFDSITSVGGGGGGAASNGVNGGSGGGAQRYDGSTHTGGSASPAGQGNKGGDSYTSAAGPSGGGGGAGAAGASEASGGIGGNGLGITLGGSTTTRGGGGGGGNQAGSLVDGGSGGGGYGGRNNIAGGDGSANTGGGGGGGGSFGYNGGNGGSGIVIVQYTTADFTHTGGDSTGTVGSETWVKFTTVGTTSLVLTARVSTYYVSLSATESSSVSLSNLNSFYKVFSVSEAASATMSNLKSFYRSLSASISVVFNLAIVRPFFKTLSAIRQGAAGQCLSFDGVNDYVDCGNGVSLNIQNAITISAWVKTPDVNSIYQGITRKGISSNGIHFMFISTGGTVGGYANLGGVWRSMAVSPVLTNNVWYHLVLVYTGTSSIVYTNGIAGTPKSQSGIITGSDTSNLIIGKSAYSGTLYFNGLIDDVRIYNRAFTAQEALASYLGQYVDPTGLVGKWDFDGDALDSSGNGNNGTVYGAVYQDVPLVQGLQTILSLSSINIRIKILTVVESSVVSFLQAVTFLKTLSAAVSGSVTLTKLNSFYRTLSAITGSAATIIRSFIFTKILSATVSGVSSLSRITNYCRSLSVKMIGFTERIKMIMNGINAGVWSKSARIKDEWTKSERTNDTYTKSARIKDSYNKTLRDL